MKKFVMVAVMMLVLSVPSIVLAGGSEWVDVQALNRNATVYDWNAASKNVCIATAATRVSVKMKLDSPDLDLEGALINKYGMKGYIKILGGVAARVRSCANKLAPLSINPKTHPIRKILDVCIDNL